MFSNGLQKISESIKLSEYTSIDIKVSADVLAYMGISVNDGDDAEKPREALSRLPIFKDFEPGSFGISPGDWDKPEGKQGLMVEFRKKSTDRNHRKCLTIEYVMDKGLPTAQIQGNLLTPVDISANL